MLPSTKIIPLFGAILILLSGISCRGLDASIKSKLERQLFLSRRIVTDKGELDGGVLVNENGIIEELLTRAAADALIAASGNKIKVIDGGCTPLMPGGVDSHVHVNEPGRTSWEGYETATKAAAWGGFTTIVDMPLNSIPPTTTVENLKIKASVAKEEVYVDVGFWGGVIPGNSGELRGMIDAGVIGFKCFLIDSGVPEFPKVDPEDIEKAFAVLNGTQTVYAFHAELPVNNVTNADCNGCGCQDPQLYNTYLETRPAKMELDAVSLVASYIPRYDVHTHIVHVSAEAVVPILEEARQKRIAAGNKRWRGGVTAETCHHYLSISAEEIPRGHTEFKCSPPIRNTANRQMLWKYIKEKRLDLIASDHSPSVANLKGPNFFNAWGGISSVQFGLSLFWTEAKARGFSLETVSHYLSAGPARLAGLYKRKGAIRPGLDADLIFFDPDASFTVTPEIIQYKNKISPYMNRVLRGKVIKTFLRGRQIYSNGQLVGGPQGELLMNNK
ncbi:allantoinase-like isoform X2 [Epargyreus clarus]|uniref:allantoinase-like isoform X2 n=1 Tax=Epargyreus clarus TaxID=520877 RepID=UPI003C2E83D3